MAVLASGATPELAAAQPTPAPGPCDVVVTEANADTVLGQLNHPLHRVICVEATASGQPDQRRYLRFHATDGIRHALHRPERALFHGLRIRGSWWVIQGLTVQPRDPVGSFWFIAIVVFPRYWLPPESHCTMPPAALAAAQSCSA